MRHIKRKNYNLATAAPAFVAGQSDKCSSSKPRGTAWTRSTALFFDVTGPTCARTWSRKNSFLTWWMYWMSPTSKKSSVRRPGRGRWTRCWKFYPGGVPRRLKVSYELWKDRNPFSPVRWSRKLVREKTGSSDAQTHNYLVSCYREARSVTTLRSINQSIHPSIHQSYLYSHNVPHNVHRFCAHNRRISQTQTFRSFSAGFITFCFRVGTNQNGTKCSPLSKRKTSGGDLHSEGAARWGESEKGKDQEGTWRAKKHAPGIAKAVTRREGQLRSKN